MPVPNLVTGYFILLPVKEASMLLVEWTPPSDDIFPGPIKLLLDGDGLFVYFLQQNDLTEMIIDKAQLLHQQVLSHYGDETIDGKLMDQVI